jgi:L-rhamnose mutarotase
VKEGGGGRRGTNGLLNHLTLFVECKKEKTFQAFDLVFICKKETTFQTMTRIGELCQSWWQVLSRGISHLKANSRNRENI